MPERVVLGLDRGDLAVDAAAPARRVARECVEIATFVPISMLALRQDVPLRVAEHERNVSGIASRSTTSALSSWRLDLGRQLGAVDLDDALDGGRVRTGIAASGALRRVGDVGHEERPCPGAMRSGSSIPLSSAIARQ